jgi:uncharacterized protein DUF2785
LIRIRAWRHTATSQIVAAFRRSAFSKLNHFPVHLVQHLSSRVNELTGGKMAKRIGTRLALFLMLSAFTQASAAASQDHVPHDREFWRAIAKNQFAVPDGQPLFPLLHELSGLLGSTDPELRDDLAYSIIDQWVRHQDISTTDLNSLADAWLANLRIGIGESGTDTVFKRSFSALCLASLTGRELKTPFLGSERYQNLLTDALTYLRDERDLRGFDPTKGWIHATAHTADLLANLAANPLLKAEDQRRLLRAITERLSSVHMIFSYGEQERLSLIAATLARRTDFDLAAFYRWLSELNADQKVWNDSPPKLELLQTFENNTYMLQALATHLSAEPESRQIADAKKTVLQILQRR